ncbi:MAG: enoyl-CoA hydratase-related protein [Desulfurellaceae bacterium]|nr:enoyl-CoA hydratase-related protein [Desulfurellaceae bacterium]
MSYETLLYEKQDSIATVTINRPEKRNAWTTQMSEEIITVFGMMEDDPEVLVTILTGSGEKAFSAGADLGNAKTHKVTTVGAHLASVSPKGFPVFNAVADYPKPVVAAINGFAVGIGCLITLCCDILLASDNAELGVPQVPLGILPAYGGAVRLARYVGRGKAMEMVLLGERISAEEAYRVGLVNKVVPLPELMPLAQDYASRLAALPPLAVRMAKESLNKGLDIASLKEAAQTDIYRFMLLGQTEDSHEAHKAWRERRKPVFKG